MNYFLTGLFLASVMLGCYCGFMLGGIVGYFLFAINVAMVLIGLIAAAYTAGQKQVMAKVEKMSKQTVPSYDAWHDTREEP